MTVLDKINERNKKKKNATAPEKSYNKPNSEQYCKVCLIKHLHLTAKLIASFKIYSSRG